MGDKPKWEWTRIVVARARPNNSVVLSTKTDSTQTKEREKGECKKKRNKVIGQR